MFHLRCINSLMVYVIKVQQIHLRVKMAGICELKKNELIINQPFTTLNGNLQCTHIKWKTLKNVLEKRK